jgi:ABC-type multidrug transport system fused ATPase/permease subunit
VAIVGRSGAGKSSLVGLLLGWHRAAAGTVQIDGRAIEHLGLDSVRRQIAWVDPAVHIWNRSFVDNVCYGSPDSARARVAEVLESADLVRVLETLPDGWQTPLGEGGSMLSGGEGQRVRLGRALLRPDARLAILDEPFRGLERRQRHDLLGRARALWSGATLICITHDVDSTLAFDRVLVLEGGQVIEDDSPRALAARQSRYRQLLESEERVLEGLWSDPTWRRVTLASGSLVEKTGETIADRAGVAG